MKKTKNLDISHFPVKVKNVLGSDSSVSNSRKSVKVKNNGFRKHKAWRHKLMLFSSFFFENKSI